VADMAGEQHSVIGLTGDQQLAIDEITRP
jgi:hypothetical protein